MKKAIQLINEEINKYQKLYDNEITMSVKLDYSDILKQLHSSLRNLTAAFTCEKKLDAVAY